MYKIKEKHRIVILIIAISILFIGGFASYIIIGKLNNGHKPADINSLEGKEKSGIGLDKSLAEKTSTGSSNKKSDNLPKPTLPVKVGVSNSTSGANVSGEIIVLKSISVKDFGAKGDGITDDSVAIQKAINEASANSQNLIFPSSSKVYLIKNTITLKSNLFISGYGATIHMPSQSSPKIMFKSGGEQYIRNIKIEGLGFSSENNVDGVNYETGSKTSNVQAIYIQGVDGLAIKDVRMDNMYNGLKFNYSDKMILNNNIAIDGLNIYNSRTPIYADGTNNFNIKNSVLDAGGGATHWLHCVYISADTDNFVFDNVTFKNSPGGGVTIGSSYPERSNPKNITIKNSKIENCNRGFNIYGASDVEVLNVNISRCNLGFVSHDGDNISVDNLSINNATQTVSPSGSNNKGAFELGNTTNSIIKNIIIDSAGMAGSLFNIEERIQKMTISSVAVNNMEGIRFFETASSLISDFKVENSSFEWDSITTRRINFRTAGASAIFKNNMFINNGPRFDSLAYNEDGTNILLIDNRYSGFNLLAYVHEFSRLTNNLNLDTGIYDQDK
ncbi:hypothetical protein CVV43_03260 [Candidatus Saccharibacteria bacterium HGW-Saccharibacteria-1]|jgi:hypothetical protein|nr:MAG: hypothetical protein CVV43_03260 [Candidatus Saccharibacteria bacterium HGW-Saccharibacteria-1]